MLCKQMQADYEQGRTRDGLSSFQSFKFVPNIIADRLTATQPGYQVVAVDPSARVMQDLKFKIGAGVSSVITTVGAGAAYQR